MPIEITFSIDDKGNNKIYEGDKAVARHMVNLIAMNPGTDSFNPEKGLGILRRLPTLDTPGVKNEIQQDLQYQISEYTEYQVLNVKVDSNGNRLLIGIELNGYDTIFLLDTEDGLQYNLELVANS